MKVGELFVELGINGGDKSLGTVSALKSGLGDTKSMAIETKAAILAVVYGFEQMMAASGKLGTDLTNTAQLLNFPLKNLQQYMYMAKQAGVSNGELSASFKAVQDKMTAARLGKGLPEGFAQVQSAVGLDFNKLGNTKYVVEQLIKAANVMKSAKGTGWIESFGLSDNVIAGARKGLFSDKNLNSAPTYSQGQLNALDQANRGWIKLGDTIERAFGKFNAQHGGELIKDITIITKSVIKLSEALLLIAERTGAFEKLAFGIEATANALEHLAKFSRGELTGTPEENKADMLKYDADYKQEKTREANNHHYGSEYRIEDEVARAVRGVTHSSTTSTTVNQNVYHTGDHKDTKAVGDAHKIGIKKALNSVPTKDQAN